MNNRFKSLALLILGSSFLFSCERVLMKPAPESDNLYVFDEYAKICIEKYALSDVKGVNLQALADSIRPFITADLSEDALFDYMGIITLRMQEGHTHLYNTDVSKWATYNWTEGYPIAFHSFQVDTLYYGEEANPNVLHLTNPLSWFPTTYGFLPQDPEIGYIRITSFSVEVDEASIEKMMKYLKDAKGIIIDVRSNLGGYISLGAEIASYFTNKEVLFGTNYIKNGPNPEDFAPTEMRLSPAASPYIYTGPVVVLHDRASFSTGTLFPVMMDALDNVTRIGIKSGGGTGEIVDGYLSNGWTWQISTSNLVNHLGEPTDPGLDPDIYVELDDSDPSKDEIIERAIQELQ